jgi:LPXTG-motif cell wall-anchored protein
VIKKKGKQDMKTAKKLLAILLVVVTVLAMSTAVFAQDVVVGGGFGTINVTNTTVGETYSLYKLFDATVSADGSSIVYKLPTGKTHLIAGEINGNIWFTMNTNGEITQTPEQKTALENALADRAEGSEQGQFKTWALAFAGSPLSSAVAAETSLSFKSVPYGYYFVSSTLGAVVSVTSAKPTADIIDKNQKPHWEDGKVIVDAQDNKVKLNAAVMNEDINFDISIYPTNYQGDQKIYRYYVYDILPAGMTYKPGTLAVNVIISGTPPTTINVPASGPNHYTVKYYTDAAMTTETANLANARAFKVYVPWTNTDTAEGTLLYPNAVGLHVTYTAFLDPAKAGQIDYTGPNINEANFAPFYGNVQGDPVPEGPNSRTETYITKLQIFKYYLDANNKVPLTGAEFTLTGTSGTVIYTHGERFVPDPNGTYWKLKSGKYTQTNPNTPGVDQSLYDSVTQRYRKETFTEVQGGLPVPTSIKAYVDSNGKLVFSGLGTGTYTISESVVPDGFSQAQDVTIVITFDPDTKTWSATGATYNPATGQFELEVENKSGTVLPETGGIGTTVFYILGSVLVCGAAVVLVTRKRMRNGSAER